MTMNDDDTFYLIVDDTVAIKSSTVEHPSQLPTVANISAEFGQVLNARWVQNCSSVFQNIDFSDPRIICSLVPLGLICLVVIFGNMMVIAAVKNTKKLRGATNLFIVSLAVADLTLGLVVLPFSAMFEVFGVWIFGSLWCSVWLAVDVWTCTASILHLVVISLDRYIAVTHPITYPNIMTSKRAKLLILGAWILSFVICFPPLVGWNEKDTDDSNESNNALNISSVSVMTTEDVKEMMNRCFPKCELIQDPGYVIYSAVGSFFAPMSIMLFFNWRIYRTATKTTKAIRQGWTKVKGVGGDANAVNMGIHRGGGGASNNASVSYHSNASTRTGLRAASVRQHHSVASSPLRVTSNGLSNNAKRLPNVNNDNGGSRTLPRCTSASTSGNGRITSGNKLAVTTRRTRRGSGSDTNSLMVPLLSNTHKTQVSRRLSSSTNNIHVTETDVDLKPNCLSHSTTTSSFDQTRHSRTPSSTIIHMGRPHLSHHQPCPNHVGGKTFAEQGTQTIKAFKAGNKKGDKKKGKEKHMFHWRSKSVPPVITTTSATSSIECRSSSPCSITKGQDRNRGLFKKCQGCFHLQRWRFRRQPRMKRRHSIGEHDRDSPVPTSATHASTDELSATGGRMTLHSAATAVQQQQQQQHQNQHKFGKRNIKNQVRRFRMETKAAKTLGIIVGCFICCWFPFFTMYLITAFCEDCFPALAFSIIFWLGYCNSAINPFIYAMFSRDFRNAFKRILCKFLCNRNQPPEGVGALARMGLPFAPHTVAIGLADRLPPVPTPASLASNARSTGGAVGGGSLAESTTSSGKAKKS